MGRIHFNRKQKEMRRKEGDVEAGRRADAKNATDEPPFSFRPLFHSLFVSLVSFPSFLKQSIVLFIFSFFSLSLSPSTSDSLSPSHCFVGVARGTDEEDVEAEIGVAAGAGLEGARTGAGVEGAAEGVLEAAADGLAAENGVNGMGFFPAAEGVAGV